jgi:uncharacterized repeat protein (TIGR01451 family)
VIATIDVDTDPSLTTISNVAFAGSGGLDVFTLDNEDGLEFPLRPVADLSVTKSGPAAVSAAAPVEYVIGFRNDGPSTATDVIITDTLPTGMTPRPVTGCDFGGASVSCAVGSLAPGGAGSITITADVDPALALGTALTDIATIGSGEAGIEDPDPADNTSALTSTVQALDDLGVTVTASQAEAAPGAQVGFTVVVVNNGPQRASNVVLANHLPPELADAATIAAVGTGLQVEVVVVPMGCTAAGTTATCTVGDLAVGESRTYVFTGTVPTGTPASTRLVHTATVSFAGTDAFPANNAADDAIVVVASLAQPSPAPVSSGGGALPITGGDVAILIALALAIVLVGAGLRIAGRPGGARRRAP